jgi:hypothetical protein
MSVQTTPLHITAPSRLTVGAAAVQGTNLPCHGVLVRAICPSQSIYLGVSNGVTTAAGWPMADGDVLDLRVSNVNQLWFIASAAAQSVALMPYALY